jgi:hypothetical protein
MLNKEKKYRYLFSKRQQACRGFLGRPIKQPTNVPSPLLLWHALFSLLSGKP